MKLYHSNSSPNSRRVRIFIAEKNLDIESVSVDLASGEHFSDAYVLINPRRVVPTLHLDSGISIGEVTAIWRYLEEAFPDSPLLGTTPTDKALVAMWERRMEQDGFASVMEAVRNSVPGLKGRAIAGPHDYEQIAALVERSNERVKNFYDDLNKRLLDVPYVAGRIFSAADITALVTVDFAIGGMGLKPSLGHAALKRWYDDVSVRPSAKA